MRNRLLPVAAVLLAAACSSQPGDEEIIEVIKNDCEKKARIAEVDVLEVTPQGDGRYRVKAETLSSFGTQTYTYEIERKDGALACRGLVRE